MHYALNITAYKDNICSALLRASPNLTLRARLYIFAKRYMQFYRGTFEQQK